MKKHLFSILLLGIGFSAQAQVCDPAGINDPRAGYILPDSATGFTHACPGKPYEQIIYIKAPNDTSFVLNGQTVTATVDSFVVSGVFAGLPNYIELASTPALTPAVAGVPKSDFPRLIIPGGERACISLYGDVPGGTVAAEHDINVEVRAYLRVMSVLPIDTAILVDYYKFVVEEENSSFCNGVGLRDVAAGGLSALSLSPNPAKHGVTLNFHSNAAQQANVILINLLGREVLQQPITVGLGDNQVFVPLNHLSEGMYMLKIQTKDGSIVQKLIIQP